MLDHALRIFNLFFMTEYIEIDEVIKDLEEYKDMNGLYISQEQLSSLIQDIIEYDGEDNII